MGDKSDDEPDTALQMAQSLRSSTFPFNLMITFFLDKHVINMILMKRGPSYKHV